MGKEGIEEFAIIGAGISGALLSINLKSECFDKAKFPGGRASTARNDKNLAGFDKGATVLHKSLEYKLKGKIEIFDLLSYLSSYSNELEWKDLKGFSDKFFCTQGMSHIVKNIIYSERLSLEKKLIRLERENGYWRLEFENDPDPRFFKKIISTLPLPQISSILEDNVPKEWKQYISKYGEYKSCLTLTGIWKNTPDAVVESVGKLTQSTFFGKNKEIEFISIESEKYTNSGDLCVLMQMGEEFSKKHLDNWVENAKFPTPFAIQCSKIFFPSFLKLHNIPLHLEPDFLRVHRWRYSLPSQTLFSSEGTMDFDSLEWKEYIDLCKSDELILTGDWVFGKRIINTVLGTRMLLQELM